MSKIAVAFACVVLLAIGASVANAQDARMSFFVTSKGSGDGANLGGLQGADAICQNLAKAAGAGAKMWHAYLSSDTVNARDRIGTGPWYNYKGEMIAENVAALHGDANKITKQTALTEKGTIVNGRGDTPNMHDILTGTNPDGTAAVGKTCNNWTSDNEGGTIVGHLDRMGLRDDAASKSWNSSHATRGCSQQGLISTGGNGFLYCFAVK